MRRETLREKDPPIYGENAVSLPRTFHEPPCSQCFVLHWHDCMELIRVRKGVLELHLDEQTTCSVLPGEVAVIAPRQAHQGIAGPSGVVYDVFMFMVADFLNAAPVAHKLLSALAECRVSFVPKIALPELAKQLDALNAAAQETPLASVGMVYQVLSLLMRYGRPVEKQRNPSDERFEAVIDYVAGHYAEPMSTSSLSERFGYDESYFCRRFKRSTGLTLMKYVEILRLESAQRALRHTDAPIGEIALQCGFADACYFSSRYRRHFGVKPSQERNM